MQGEESSINLRDMIAMGATGRVYYGHIDDSSRVYAIAEKLNNWDYLLNFSTFKVADLIHGYEDETGFSLHQHHLLTFIGYEGIEGVSTKLIYPLMDGTLSDLVDAPSNDGINNCGYMNSEKTINFVSHTLTALETLHSLGYGHGEIWPGNIFFLGEDFFLGDFDKSFEFAQDPGDRGDQIEWDLRHFTHLLKCLLLGKEVDKFLESRLTFDGELRQMEFNHYKIAFLFEPFSDEFGEHSAFLDPLIEKHYSKELLELLNKVDADTNIEAWGEEVIMQITPIPPSN
jgi:hypothetical protein